MTKHTMELVWHSCVDCLPEEDYNPHLYVTDGTDVIEMEWERDGDHQRFIFEDEACLFRLEAGADADGWWWADLVQTVSGFAPIQKK